MTAEAHFCCRPHSHPFTERRVVLSEPAKIGRSVAKCRPSSSNAVFDCKVLSRNHALLWYENGKFYLQDTKSSNGTFINNQRLSRTSEESGPVEVNSCDIVQFGVDVVDTAKKVTHGCIVSQLRLFLPNGEESKHNERSSGGGMEKVPLNTLIPTVQFEELYQLQQYIQEAMHREQMLEQKLALLQRHVDDGQEASAKGWQSLIDEDKILSRLEFLENQVQLYKTQDEDSLHAKLQQLEDEKFNYENTSKETLRQAVQEKLEAVQKVSNLEFLLGNLEDECTHYRMSQEEAQKNLKELSGVHQAKLKDLHQLKDSLKESENRATELEGKLEALSEEKAKSEREHLEKTEQLQQDYVKLKADFEDLQNRNVQNAAGDGDDDSNAADAEQNPSSTCDVAISGSSNEEALVASTDEPSAPAEEPSDTSGGDPLLNHNQTLMCAPESPQLSANREIPSSATTTSTSSTTSSCEEELMKVEARLRERLADTERQLRAIRLDTTSTTTLHNTTSTSSLSSSTQQDAPSPSNNQQHQGSSSKQNKSFKNKSLMHKLPSVKFGKRSSKKKAVPSESDVGELSNLMDVDELHKELTSCREQLELKNNHIIKLEKDLTMLQSEMKDQEEQEDVRRREEVDELKQQLQQLTLHCTDINHKLSQVQDELERRNLEFLDLEKSSSELREQVEEGRVIVDEMEAKHATHVQRCCQLSDQLALVDKEREEMGRELVEVRSLMEGQRRELDEERSKNKQLATCDYMESKKMEEEGEVE